MIKDFFKLLTIITCSSIIFIGYFFSISFASDCTDDINVCNWLEKVFILKTKNTTASAVKLNENYFVTNKHVVEDNLYVELIDDNNSLLKAQVLQNEHPSDLVILSINNKKKINIKPNTIINDYNGLRSVAFGIGRGTIRIFPKGDLISIPSENLKQARIHSTIRNLPGISGGALINSKGQLVGILTSGSGYYNEAIPVNILNEVIQVTTRQMIKNSSRYKSIKKCAQLIEIMNINMNLISRNEKLVVEQECSSANLKSFFDMLGQIFGNAGDLEKSLLYLEKSSLLDPNSPTSLISLAVAYQFNRDFKTQAKVLQKLIKLIPKDVLVLRMAIQSAAFSNNIDFARQSLDLIKVHNNKAFNQAYDFLKQYFPQL